MVKKIVFESHASSEDNERGIASGHFDPGLSQKGKQQSIELGKRYTKSLPDIIFCSDLSRSYETARIAFPSIETLQDSRLREWDYGDYNGKSAAEVERLKMSYRSKPFPGGESLEGALQRILACLDEQFKKYPKKKLMLIGHRATYYALEHRYRGRALEDILRTKWTWQPGWVYQLDESHCHEHFSL